MFCEYGGLACFFDKDVTSCRGNDAQWSTHTECYQVTVTLNFIGLDTWIFPFSNLSSTTIGTDDGRLTNAIAKVSSEHSHKCSALMIQCTAAMRGSGLYGGTRFFLLVSLPRSRREVNINQKAYMHACACDKCFLIMT